MARKKRKKPEIVESEQRKLWDRQEDEPMRWFQRFEIYRALGPGRTLIGSHRRFCDMIRSPHRKMCPPHWLMMAKEWQWERRALAFDDWEIKRIREAEHEARLELHKRHAEVASRIFGKGVEALDTVGDLKPKDVLAWLDVGARMEKAALGEVEEIAKKRDEEHERPVDQLTDEELQAIIAAGRARGADDESSSGGAQSSLGEEIS